MYQKVKTDKFVICPKCYRKIEDVTFVTPPQDRYREIRRYFGWCDNCSVGFEVIQFKNKDKWHIHKYQPYAYRGINNDCSPLGAWIQVQKLPEPAPVVTGPGGQYCRQVTPRESQLVATIKKSMEAIDNALRIMFQRKIERDE